MQHVDRFTQAACGAFELQKPLCAATRSFADACEAARSYALSGRGLETIKLMLQPLNFFGVSIVDSDRDSDDVCHQYPRRRSAIELNSSGLPQMAVRMMLAQSSR